MVPATSWCRRVAYGWRFATLVPRPWSGWRAWSASWGEYDPAPACGAHLRGPGAGEPAQIVRGAVERGAFGTVARSADWPSVFVPQSDAIAAEDFDVDARRLHHIAQASGPWTIHVSRPTRRRRWRGADRCARAVDAA